MNLLITGGCGFIGSNFINVIFKLKNELNINYTKFDLFVELPKKI